MNHELDAVTVTLLVIVLAFFAIIFLTALVMKFFDFIHELDYINQEIARTTGEEQKYWKQEKRRLWLSFLPFCRR